MVQAKKRRTRKTTSDTTRRKKRVVVTRYRSGLEQDVALDLNKKGVVYEYESAVFRYVLPMQYHRYIPDFVLPNAIYVEVKGRLTFFDRRKYLAVKESNPGIGLRFLFQKTGGGVFKITQNTDPKK